MTTSFWRSHNNILKEELTHTTQSNAIAEPGPTHSSAYAKRKHKTRPHYSPSNRPDHNSNKRREKPRTNAIQPRDKHGEGFPHLMALSYPSENEKQTPFIRPLGGISYLCSCRGFVNGAKQPEKDRKQKTRWVSSKHTAFAASPTGRSACVLPDERGSQKSITAENQ